MKPWTLKLAEEARRDFRQLEEGPKRDAAELMQDLQEDPFSVPAIQLRSHQPGTMRARFHNNYRMVFQISKAENRIIVLKIKPRDRVYKGMKH